MNKIKKNDEVIITTGKDKGKRGIINKILSNEKVIIDGINLVKKHIKSNPKKGIQGGISEKEMPIHQSNIAIYNPKTNKADKIGFRFNEHKKKERFFKSNNETISN